MLLCGGGGGGGGGGDGDVFYLVCFLYSENWGDIERLIDSIIMPSKMVITVKGNKSDMIQQTKVSK